MWIRKMVEVPGPQELGMADSDALGSRKLTPFQEGPTWEDWDERVKQEYPVRYFASEVVGAWLSRQAGRMEHRWDWLISHTIRRYHLVDLRGVDPLGYYEWGYIVPAEIMRLAGWKALQLYMERAKDPATLDYPDESRQQDWYKDEKARHEEAKALLHYWMVERRQEQEADEKLHDEVEAAGEAGDREKHEEAQKRWLESYRAIEIREDEMFQRLAKLQPYLIR